MSDAESTCMQPCIGGPGKPVVSDIVWKLDR